ncbi:MAG: hypothetical protein GY835_14910 [bacterium]|nr:hypothetical protein [bacterium]
MFRPMFMFLLMQIPLLVAGGAPSLADSSKRESLVVAGAGNGVEVVTLLASEFRLAHPEYSIEVPVENIGHEGALDWVLRDRNLLGRLEHPLTTRRKLKLPQACELPVAGLRLSVIAPSELGVTKLSLRQWRDIFTGGVKNWSQVGGPDLPVVLVGPAETSGVNRALLHTYPIFASIDFEETCLRDQQVLSTVARIPGALGICETRSLRGARGVAPIEIAGFACERSVSLVFDRRNRNEDVISLLRTFLQSETWREVVTANQAWAPIASRPVGKGRLKIGLLWVGRSADVDLVAKGFLERIREVAPAIEVETRMELRDLSVAETFVRHFEEDKDGIVFLGADGVQFLGEHTLKVPGFIGACSAVKVGEVLGGPELQQRNVTGVMRHQPIADCIDLLNELLPDAKRVGLLCEADHSATGNIRERTRSECVARGLEYRELICGSEDELATGVKQLAGQVDAMIIADQPLLAKASRTVIAAAGDTPVCAFTSGFLDAGAMLAVTVDDFELGRMLADSVTDVVIRGRSCADLSIKIDPTPLPQINADVCRKYEVALSSDLRRKAVTRE